MWRVLRRRERAVDQLDPVAVGIGDEADPILLAPTRRVGRLLGLDAGGGELLEQPVEVVDGERHVVVALTEVIRLLTANVHRQLEHVAAVGQPHADVVGGLEVQPAAMLEAEALVELPRRVDVFHPDACVYEARAHACGAYCSTQLTYTSINASIAASTPATSPVASRSSSSPRVTATPRRAWALARSRGMPSVMLISATGSTQLSTIPSSTSVVCARPCNAWP